MKLDSILIPEMSMSTNREQGAIVVKKHFNKLRAKADV